MNLPALPEFAVGGVKDNVLGLVSRYYRGKSTIAKAGVQMQAVLPFVVSSRDGKLALVKNSKSGCTSLAHAIYTYDTGRAFAGNIHREGPHLTQGYSNWQKNWSLLKDSKCLKISAVRRPTDRVVSAFLDFVIEARNPLRVYHAAVFKDFGLDAETSVEQRFEAFLDMIEASLHQGSWRTDRHWRPQTQNLWVEEIDYDLLMRTDRLDVGFRKLSAVLNVSADRLALAHKNRSSDKRSMSLTRHQLRRVEQLYPADFDLYESIPE